MSSKSQTKAFFLCLFFGCLGFHRFYVGKIFTGLLWLVTLGFCGIGVIIDLFNILIGNFTDGYGLKLDDDQNSEENQKTILFISELPDNILD